MNSSMRRLRSLSADHLTRDLLEDCPGHRHEVFARGVGKLAAVDGSQGVALNDHVLTIGEDGGGTAAATAEHRVSWTVCSNDFMDFHYFYWFS